MTEDGKPSILNQVAGISNRLQLLTADFNVLFGINQFSWGIYLAGTNTPAVIPDSIVSLDFKYEYKIADYPMEPGSFTTYNKVATPFTASVRMAVGRNANDRGAFLNRIDRMAASTALYDIITPEHIYLNANVVDYSYKRTDTNGAGMIVADVKLMEVRLTGSMRMTETQSTADQRSVSLGQIAPVPTTDTPASIEAAS